MHPSPMLNEIKTKEVKSVNFVARNLDEVSSLDRMVWTIGVRRVACSSVLQTGENCCIQPVGLVLGLKIGKGVC